jgi:cytochrome c-type biogenesis protein CcmH/NrfF
MTPKVEVTEADETAARQLAVRLACRAPAFNSSTKSDHPITLALATHRINAVRPLVERGKALADVLDAMPPAALGPAAKLALTLFRTALQGVKQHDAETLS